MHLVIDLSLPLLLSFENHDVDREMDRSLQPESLRGLLLKVRISSTLRASGGLHQIVVVQIVHRELV